MKPIALSLASLCLSAATSQAVTTLPVGPFTFSSNADYDNNFKEGSTGSLRVDTGSLRVSSLDATTAGIGSAIYDTSVTPGTGGNGGTGGTDNNNDLSDFTVSSVIQFQNRGGQSTIGYFLRMDGSEAGGYLATATFYNSTAPLAVRFDLFKNVDLNFVPAISGTSTPPSGFFASTFVPFTTAAATNFNFSVTAIGSDFTFTLANAANTTSVSATLSDPGTTVLTGQVGVFLRAQQQTGGSTSRLDDFTITIPEPSSALLLGSAASLLFVRRRKTSAA
jgi:hypothetical protein